MIGHVFNYSSIFLALYLNVRSTGMESLGYNTQTGCSTSPAKIPATRYLIIGVGLDENIDEASICTDSATAHLRVFNKPSRASFNRESSRLGIFYTD